MDNQVHRKQATKAARSSSSTSSPKQFYLLAYNGACLLLWIIVTGRAAVLLPTLVQHEKLFALKEALWPIHPIAQGIALLEVLHAMFGIVRASPVTTAMQVASRILVVFGILYPFPEIVAFTNVWGRSEAGPNYGPVAFAALIAAHGITEVIRYGFFVWKEGVSETIPGPLLWLRYNTFFVLYPLGISSECWLMYLALEPAQDLSPIYNLFLKAVLVAYVPGSYVLYTHMMSQRRKVLKGKRKQQ